MNPDYDWISGSYKRLTAADRHCHSARSANEAVLVIA